MYQPRFTSLRTISTLLFLGSILRVFSVAKGLESYSNDDDTDQDDASGRVSLGSFDSYAHDLAGEVTLIDDKTAEITGLTYDGRGPAAWFMVGKSDSTTLPERTDLDGTVIPDENETCETLKLYRGEDITLKLPGKMKWSDFTYISMYCVRFNHNFGYVSIPENMKLKNGTSTVKECDPDDISAVEDNIISGPDPNRPRPRPPSTNFGPGPSQPSSGSSGGLLSGLLGILGG